MARTVIELTFSDLMALLGKKNKEDVAVDLGWNVIEKVFKEKLLPLLKTEQYKELDKYAREALINEARKLVLDFKQEKDSWSGYTKTNTYLKSGIEDKVKSRIDEVLTDIINTKLVKAEERLNNQMLSNKKDWETLVDNHVRAFSKDRIDEFLKEKTEKYIEFEVDRRVKAKLKSIIDT
jgi:hypothetical protein